MITLYQEGNSNWVYVIINGTKHHIHNVIDGYYHFNIRYPLRDQDKEILKYLESQGVELRLDEKTKWHPKIWVKEHHLTKPQKTGK